MRNLAAATVRYRMVRLHALTARADAERFRPGRSPRDEPRGPDMGSTSPGPGTLTALDPAPAARGRLWRNPSGDIRGPVVDPRFSCKDRA